MTDHLPNPKQSLLETGLTKETEIAEIPVNLHHLRNDAEEAPPLSTEREKTHITIEKKFRKKIEIAGPALEMTEESREASRPTIEKEGKRNTIGMTEMPKTIREIRIIMIDMRKSHLSERIEKTTKNTDAGKIEVLPETSVILPQNIAKDLLHTNHIEIKNLVKNQNATETRGRKENLPPRNLNQNHHLKR